MKRVLIGLIAATGCVQVLAQNNGQPAYEAAVPAASAGNHYDSWGDYSQPGTAAGSALDGMASAISAKGDYNLSTSAAAINWTEAQSNHIKNRNEATNTYFEMRATNKAAREAESGPRPTMEQLVKISKDRSPRPLTSDQMDPVTGQLYWPGPLQDDAFASRRAEVQELFAKQVNYGGLPYAEQTKAKEALNTMFGALKGQIASIPTPDYIASRKFLNSLMYTTTKSTLQ